MSVLGTVHMPKLDAATGWLNSEPLDPEGLRGRVVLVNFWTLTCINWLRQEPYVRAWSHVLTAHTETHGSMTASSVVIETHCPRGIRVGLLCVAVAGLLLLFLPRRENTKA